MFILGLDNCEKDFLTNLLRRDAGMATSEQVSESLISWRQVQRIFIDSRIYLYAAISIGDLGGIKYLMGSLPPMMQELGYSTDVAHLMTIFPYIVSCLVIVLSGYTSSRFNEHTLHHGLLTFIAIFGCILMISLESQGKTGAYISVCIACSGAFSALSIFWSWVANNVGGNTKRTVAVGIMSGIGQIGAIVQPQVIKILSYNHRIQASDY